MSADPYTAFAVCHESTNEDAALLSGELRVPVAAEQVEANA